MKIAPVRIRLSRQGGFRLQAHSLALNGLPAVKVDRSTRWGNPFNLKAPDHCWTAIAFGHLADPAGRHAASVTMFRLWIEAQRPAKVDGCGLYGEKDGVRLVVAESPIIEAPPPPSLDDIRQELCGRNLACWCPLTDRHGVVVPCHAAVLIELANTD